MKTFFSPIFAILWKDILLETRTKDILVAILVFSLLVIIIFNFALDPTPGMIALVAPGVLWVAFVFGGVLGLARSFAIEEDGGNIDALLLAPIGRDSIFLGKMLSNFLFMLLVETLVFPIFAVLFNFSLTTPGMVPVALLATLGIATVGTLFSAMSVNTRVREVMLPLLFFPLIVPVILAAVEASGILLRDGALGDTGQWLPLLAAYDAIFLVICPVAFHLVVEE